MTTEDLVSYAKNPWLFNDKIRQRELTIRDLKKKLAVLEMQQKEEIPVHDAFFRAKDMKIPSVDPDVRQYV
jgi:hypothetical protein